MLYTKQFKKDKRFNQICHSRYTTLKENRRVSTLNSKIPANLAVNIDFDQYDISKCKVNVNNAYLSVFILLNARESPEKLYEREEE